VTAENKLNKNMVLHTLLLLWSLLSYYPILAQDNAAPTPPFSNEWCRTHLADADTSLDVSLDPNEYMVFLSSFEGSSILSTANFTDLPTELKAAWEELVTDDSSIDIAGSRANGFGFVGPTAEQSESLQNICNVSWAALKELSVTTTISPTSTSANSTSLPAIAPTTSPTIVSVPTTFPAASNNTQTSAPNISLVEPVNSSTLSPSSSTTEIFSTTGAPLSTVGPTSSPTNHSANETTGKDNPANFTAVPLSCEACLEIGKAIINNSTNDSIIEEEGCNMYAEKEGMAQPTRNVLCKKLNLGPLSACTEVGVCEAPNSMNSTLSSVNSTTVPPNNFTNFTAVRISCDVCKDIANVVMDSSISNSTIDKDGCNIYAESQGMAQMERNEFCQNLDLGFDAACTKGGFCEVPNSMNSTRSPVNSTSTPTSNSTNVTTFQCEECQEIANLAMKSFTFNEDGCRNHTKNKGMSEKVRDNLCKNLDLGPTTACTRAGLCRGNSTDVQKNTTFTKSNFGPTNPPPNETAGKDSPVDPDSIPTIIWDDPKDDSKNRFLIIGVAIAVGVIALIAGKAFIDCCQRKEICCFREQNDERKLVDVSTASESAFEDEPINNAELGQAPTETLKNQGDFNVRNDSQFATFQNLSPNTDAHTSETYIDEITSSIFSSHDDSVDDTSTDDDPTDDSSIDDSSMDKDLTDSSSVDDSSMDDSSMDTDSTDSSSCEESSTDYDSTDDDSMDETSESSGSEFETSSSESETSSVEEGFEDEFSNVKNTRRGR